jgi:hypothetical protein
MNIGERLGKTLPGAGISPRNLAAVTKVHFTTIYGLIRTKGKTYPLVEQTLSDALNKIDNLVADGKLPIRDTISTKEKTKRLGEMLAAND